MLLRWIAGPMIGTSLGERLAAAVTALPAIGWARNFLEPDRFAPPRTAIHFIIEHCTSGGAAAWAIATAVIACLSVITRPPVIRLVLTTAAGSIWTMIAFVSLLGGVFVTGAGMTAVMCIIVLAWVQWAIMAEIRVVWPNRRLLLGWPRDERRSRHP